MALTAAHAGAQHWPRWGQEQSGHEYAMMESSAMIPYQRPAMDQVYVVPPPAYQQAAPVVELQPSPFEAQVSYGFQPMPTQMQHSHSDMGHQYRPQPHIQELTPPRVMDPDHDHGSYASSPASAVVPVFRRGYPAYMAHHGAAPMQQSHSFVGRQVEYKALTYGQQQQTPSPTPSIKCESIREDDNNDPTTGHKTITTNITDKGTLQAEFHTSIDELMKTIQAKEEIVQTIITDEVKQSPSQITEVAPVPAAPTVSVPVKAPKVASKKHVCNVPECGRRFSQKTHLDMHLRSHINYRPYACTWPGCNTTVSQLGNLKAHIRRHTGERPYQCDECGKRFAQRGNVQAHQNVHLNQKPYQCKLDDCNKRFSQRGNLKSHQNHFHAETLKGLTAKFAQIAASTTVSEKDKDFLEYFAKLYKNSNKGIKGRGKACKIASTITPASSSSSSSRVVSGVMPMSPPGSAARSPVSPMDTPTTTANMHHQHQQQQQQVAPPQYGGYGLAAQMPLPNGHATYAVSASASAPAAVSGYYSAPAAVAPHPASYGMTAGGRPMITVQTGGEGMHHAHHQQQQQHHHQQQFTGSFHSSDGSVHSAATTLYEGEHGRELAFGDRMY